MNDLPTQKRESLLRTFLIIFATLLALNACGSSGAEKGSTIKGKRVAVLEQNHTIQTDKDVQGSKIELPSIDVLKSWPQAGYSPLHILPNAAVESLPKKVWSSSIGHGSDSDFKLLAYPVVANDTVFTMDSKGDVRAFATKNGYEIWELDTSPKEHDDDEVGGGLGFDNDTLYATTGFGEVLAIHASDGKVKWRRTLLNPIRGAPTIADGRVYVVSIDNEVQALDAKTGEVLWHHRGITESATLMGASNPAVSGESVIVAYSSGEIFNLRPENGRVIWSYTLTVPAQVGALPAIADIHGQPVLSGDRVFAISHSGRIAAIDHRTGDRAWEADIGGTNTPLVAGNTVFVLSNDNQLVSLDRMTGRVRWVQQLAKLEDLEDHESDHVFWTGPTLAANRLWLGNSLGQIVSYSPDDGHKLDMIDVSDPVYLAPVVAGNTMYVVLDSGRIVALR